MASELRSVSAAASTSSQAGTDSFEKRSLGYLPERTFLPTAVERAHELYHTGVAFKAIQGAGAVFERFQKTKIHEMHGLSKGEADKAIWVVDGLLSRSESGDLRNFTENQSFPVPVFSSEDAAKNGEKPTRSLSERDSYKMIVYPECSAIATAQTLFAALGEEMDATISTQPWKACNLVSQRCADAIVSNHVEEVTEHGMQVGWHTDYDPSDGLLFAIPKIEKEEIFDPTKREFYPPAFENGSAGNPWMITAMLYSAEEHFKDEEWGMGTAFAKKDDAICTVGAKHGRIVFFEGDALHTMQPSTIPSGTQTWRVSYVWKLLVRPNNPEESPSLKERFIELIHPIMKSKVEDPECKC